MTEDYNPKKGKKYFKLKHDMYEKLKKGVIHLGCIIKEKIFERYSLLLSHE